jgi:hypothetical protein
METYKTFCYVNLVYIQKNIDSTTWEVKNISYLRIGILLLDTKLDKLLKTTLSGSFPIKVERHAYLSAVAV